MAVTLFINALSSLLFFLLSSSLLNFNTSVSNRVKTQEEEKKELGNTQMALSEEQETPPREDQKPNTIFSLTLDEIQMKSGRTVGSMNMDDFLTSLWNSVDENLIPIPEPNPIEHQQLRRQNSFAIPIQICKKTVEEVWLDIQKDQTQNQKLEQNNPNPIDRQQTYGEITLEDFLIKAGVVQQSTKHKLLQPQQQPIPMTLPPQQQPVLQNLDQSYGLYANNNINSSNSGSYMMNASYATYPIYAPVAKRVNVNATVDNSVVMGNNSESVDTTAGNGKSTKKRIIDGPPEIVVERRQRRMIKNRESAARSRARKQAYTVELEVELNQLREENEKLRKIVREYEEMEANQHVNEEEEDN